MVNIDHLHGLLTITEKTYIDPMLGYCWPAVSDVGPTLTQHWVNVSCLLGFARVVRVGEHPVFNDLMMTELISQAAYQVPVSGG